MTFDFLHSDDSGAPILVPEIGLELKVRIPPSASGGQLTIIETVNAPGFGPPLHRHRESEIFHVTAGCYLFEVDGKRFHAKKGDVVSVPGGAAHGFVNVTMAPAGQFILILPGIDAAAFFVELGAVMKQGGSNHAGLAEFGRRWGVEFLGPPLRPDRQAACSPAQAEIQTCRDPGIIRRAGPVAVNRRSSFFVGGAYVGPPEARIMQGQMFVEAFTPEHVMRPYPLVLIHGAAQTAVNWMTTPDGRQGWAEWFASQGWTVYLVDQPARGRSAWQPGVDGAPKPVPVSVIENLFTAPEDANGWPQARLHTQWPGGSHKGHAGDPVFDQFYASQVASLGNVESEKLVQAAGAALLDRIGPAILVTHSQAGLFGWLIADIRPELVKGIVALEPAGPPYKDAVLQTGTDRSWGLTSLPLCYDPPVTPDAPLEFEQQAQPDAPDLLACWFQKGSPRRLVNLTGVPVLVATTEASYHAMYDHCTARYLSEAGVKTEFVRLADVGLRGNGHMMMLERNSLEIAAFLDAWMTANIR